MVLIVQRTGESGRPVLVSSLSDDPSTPALCSRAGPVTSARRGAPSEAQSGVDEGSTHSIRPSTLIMFPLFEAGPCSRGLRRTAQPGEDADRSRSGACYCDRARVAGRATPFDGTSVTRSPSHMTCEQLAQSGEARTALEVGVLMSSLTVLRKEPGTTMALLRRRGAPCLERSRTAEEARAWDWWGRPQ